MTNFATRKLLVNLGQLLFPLINFVRFIFLIETAGFFALIDSFLCQPTTTTNMSSQIALFKNFAGIKTPLKTNFKNKPSQETTNNSWEKISNYHNFWHLKKISCNTQ